MTVYSKSLYRISEVAAMLNLPATTLKYWTDTFDEVRPQPVGTGRQVKYRPEDIETIKLIQILMHERVMTIEGAKKYLANSRKPSRQVKCDSPQDAIDHIVAVTKMVKENPKAVAILESVMKWIENNAQSFTQINLL